MVDGPLRVLFLCTGNSARSQMAEALLRHLTNGRVDAFSAGSHPQGTVHPMALQTLRERFGIDPSGLWSKSVNRLVHEGFDYVITVCDNARDVCPVFPGGGEHLYWSFEDPAAVADEGKRRRAFESVATGLATRLRAFVALPAVSRRLAPQ